MSDQPQGPDKGNGKAWVTFAAAICTTYSMNWLSLRGVDFQVLGVPSELVKSGIEGLMLGFFAWITPDHAVDAMVESILWCRRAVARVWSAITQPLQNMRKP